MAEQYLAAVKTIYESALDPELWPAALEAIAISLGGRVANLFYVRDDGTFRLIISTNFPRDAADAYHSHWWKYDIRTQKAIDQQYTHWRGAQTDLDLVNQEEVNASPFYTDFLWKNDFGWIVAIGVSPDPGTRVALTVQFGLNIAIVTDDHRAKLERIAPHVENALRLSLRLQESDVIRDGLTTALSGLDAAVVMLGTAGHVVFANPIAKELFGEEGTQIGGFPRVGPDDVRRSVQKAIADLLSGNKDLDPQRPLLLRDSDGRMRAVLYLLPVADLNAALAHVSMILLAIRVEGNAPPEPTLVRDLLGLTLGEARVAALVGSGMSPQHAAEKLGITIDTIRTVLKNIFPKIGVSKQSELTALLTRMVLR